MPAEKSPIRLFVFYHDDINENTRKIVPRQYLKDCVEEIQKITGRSVVMKYEHHIPGITDYDYKGDMKKAIEGWGLAVGPYVTQNSLRWLKTYRYILVTKDLINETVMGVAKQKGNCCIASLGGYQIIAHELGHTFNATHEDAELIWNSFGVLSETYMFPFYDNSRPNAYQYSLKNRKNISDFLANEA